MDATAEVLYARTMPANAMKNALSTEMSLTPTTLQIQQQQDHQQTQLSPLATTTATTPTTPRTTTHTPREIPSMYILDQMYDDYLDQYNDSNNITAPTEVPETNASTELAPCPICSRTFNPVTLRKHVGICEKMAMKKRNIFDSSRQRREGTDLETYPLPKNFGLPEKAVSNTSITLGRNDRGHSPKPAIQQVSSPIMTRKKPTEDLSRSTVRTSMRKAVAANNSTVVAATSTPVSSFNRDRMRSSERSLTRRGIQPPPAEQCPHCERCFGIKAYDRHVEWCKEKALLASIKQGNSKNDGNVAKARLEARTKYRAPCLKTKRSINREKYSGLAGEEPEIEDTSKCSKTSLNKTQETGSMSMSMTSSMCSERKITNYARGNINEPVPTKAHKNNSAIGNRRKCLRDKVQTLEPPPTTSVLTAAASKEIQKNNEEEEPLRNLEIQMPQFLLMGEEVTTTAVNKKLRTKPIQSQVEDTVAAAKIKPRKQKQQQTAHEQDFRMNSTKSYQKWKTTDVQIDLPPSPTLERKKSSSDLSLKSVCRDIIDSHYDNLISDFDEVKFKANEESIENLGDSVEKTPKGNSFKERAVNTKMTIDEYFDKEDIYDLGNDDYSRKTSSSFQCNEHEIEEDIFQNASDDSKSDCSSPKEPSQDDSCYPMQLQNQDLMLKHLDLKELKDLSKSSANGNNMDSAREHIPKSLANKHSKEKKSPKPIRNKSRKTQSGEFKEIEINKTRKLGCKEFEENMSLVTQTSYTDMEIYKDCLTDSDELRRQKLAGKEETNETTIEKECKDIPLSHELKTIGNSRESNTFKSDQSENYKDERCLKSRPSIKRSKSSKDLDCLKTNSRNCNPTKSKEKIKKSSPPPPPAAAAPRIATPRMSHSSSLYTPMTNSNETTNKKSENSCLLSLKMCQPKRKKVLRQTASCTSSFPMKAHMSIENLTVCGVSSSPQIKGNNMKEHTLALAGEDIEEEIVCKDKKCNDNGVDETINNKFILDKEIKVIKEPPQLKRNRSFTVINLPDNYDPFLSAKRQLEELCSPTTDSIDVPPPTTPQTPQLPSIPATPNGSSNNSKMSTSLILNSPIPNTTASLMTTSHMPQQTQKTPTLVRSSSFRRTSSLRGPRRSPLLSSRPPLFAQKHRPTIQRGLSDEGPISTNFLKPEEYDEMPVRSVCVNDFAINKSPRVVRRDTSTSNRKQPLRLNINAANENTSTSTVSPNVVNNNSASKYVSKTDSLAVFLKFEHELEKLNAAAADSAHKNGAVSTPSTSSTVTTPQSNLDGPLNAKELKDKSNNLSKQNSAKNIKADILATNDGTENCDKNLNDTAQLSGNDIESGKYGQVRLAPLAAKTSTPLTKPSTPQIQLQQQHTTTPQLIPLIAKTSLALTQEQKALKSPKPVALSSIFGSENKNTKQTPSQYTTERKNSMTSDYIDPKLINKCDNLPINLSLKRTEFKLAGSGTSEQRLEQFSSSSSDSSAPTKKPSSQHNQHTQFLPTVKQEQQPQQHQELEQHEQNNNLNLNINQNPNQNHLPVTSSQRNSAEGRNLLKRRMRLGRNQFLYDASPEGDSCSADDEGANRSSMEGDAAQQHYNSMRESEKVFERLSSTQTTSPTDAPFIPPLPAFDDFDFEEFLSSFENDEEQFPLFKDCREFLMNRTSKKQRSMLVPNSATQNTTNFKKSPSPQTFPPLTPQSHHITGHHFQFPTLSQHPKYLFNSFSLNTRARNKCDEVTGAKSSDTFSVNSHTEEYKDLLDSQAHDKNREIFISIETEQNDLDKSPISPNSIRNMVGNPQTVVEVEVDAAHDNKFSKISDDDDGGEASQNISRSKNFTSHMAAKHLPNVQLNNAKNLMQKIHEDFRQASDELCGNLRLTMEHHRTAPVDVNMNINSNSTATGNVRTTLNMNRPAGTPSGDTYGDSDELSSLDGYPLSSPNSRLGISSKTSADSAYGSLSRQRSSELTSQRSSCRNRAMNSSNTGNNSVLNRPLTEETSLGRSRQLSASSSSSSEHGLPPITSSNNSFHQQQQQHPHPHPHPHQQQQQQQQTLYNNNNNMSIINDLDDLINYEFNNNNNHNNNYDIQSTPHATLTGVTNSHSNLESLQQYTSSNSTMSSSMKLSKFCHECGSKFLLEQAKFCMDCGVKRIVL